jgi:hypothetical protein
MAGRSAQRLPEKIAASNNRVRHEDRGAHEVTVMEATIMKQVGLISTGVLLLLFGTVAPAHAQERQEQEAQSPKQEQQAKPEKQQQAKGQQKQEKEQQQQAKGQQKQEKAQQQQAKGQQKQEKEQQQQAKGQQKQEKEQQQQAKSQQRQQGQQQARSSQGPRRSQQDEARQRSAPPLRLSSRSERRIPDESFRSHFGREHRFRIGGPRMVDGYSRFQYGGFWFGFVDPWPEGWYYTDDVYVDYEDGGYFLYNPYYPGVRIAICVVM